MKAQLYESEDLVASLHLNQMQLAPMFSNVACIRRLLL
jgi:hypothetical protein